jgi:F-type H+-transporting ATPase subunit gamma
MTDMILAWHGAEEIGAAYIVYTNFLSTFEQEAVSRQLIPITREAFANMVEQIRPAKGKYAPRPKEEVSQKVPVYTVEPNADAVITTLLPRLLNVAIFHGLLESKASEHSARMVAMKNATDNAKEKAKEYTRTFNKVRQAAITREISEITSGIEAMR